MGKIKFRVVAIAVAIILVISMMTACGGNDRNNNSASAGGNNSSSSSESTSSENNSSNSSQNTGAESSSSNQGSNQEVDWNDMFLGWGKVGEELTFDTPTSSAPKAVLDANIFLLYVQENYFHSSGLNKLGYNGEELTLIDSGTKNPGQLQFKSVDDFNREAIGYGRVYVLSYIEKPDITYIQNGEEKNLLDTAIVEVYYSIEKGVLSRAEFKSIK